MENDNHKEAQNNLICKITSQYITLAMISRAAELLIHITIFFKQRRIEERAAASVYVVKGGGGENVQPVSRHRETIQCGHELL